MKPIKIYYDAKGNTLNVWFDKPENEVYCEETVEEINFSRNKDGKVIGFEILNFLPTAIRRKIKEIPIESKVINVKAISG